MANKTIYFSHNDERYIEGTLPSLSMSLSAALMAGYRLLVERQQATHDGFHEVQLRVGKDGVYQHKIFMGRKIYRAKQLFANSECILRKRAVMCTMSAITPTGTIGLRARSVARKPTTIQRQSNNGGEWRLSIRLMSSRRISQSALCKICNRAWSSQ